MIVEAIIEIRGRGPCAIVRGAPADCLGKSVHQNGHIWKIIGVGWPELNGVRDLLLRAEQDAPDRPLLGEIELVE